MSRATPYHLGSLYDHNDSPFRAIWNGRLFTVYSNGRNNSTMQQPLFFANCVSCLSCGPVYENCQPCNSLFLPHIIVNSQDHHQILHYSHPIVLACEAEKPCILPNNVEEFNNMYSRQESLRSLIQDQPNTSTFCALTTEEIGNKIRTILNERPQDRNKTHELHFVIWGCPTNYAIVKRQSDYLNELLHGI